MDRHERSAGARRGREVEGCDTAGVGAVTVCKGRAHLGGIAMATEYISFRPGEVAAVKMVNRPAFFDTFAATIRHRPLSDSASEIEYKYNFSARPRWLRFLLHPIMEWAFALETRSRLRALRRYFVRQEPRRPVRAFPDS